MDPNRFDRLTQALTATLSRRGVGRALAGLPFGGPLALRGLAGAERVDAKKKTAKKCRGCCLANGNPCKKKGRTCKTGNCLNAPFTIVANWTVTADHDTYLFVPPENDTTGPSPHINYSCNEGNSTCEGEYPFACVDGDVQSSGDEETTIYTLLKGTYEYWIDLYQVTLAGELTIILLGQNGRIVRQWQNPANPTADQKGWHVFDINGNTGSVNSIDDLIGDTMPAGAHNPNTYVCP